MIKKAIVEKIICENKATQLENPTTETEEISCDTLKWSKSRLSLRDYIANLSSEEILDLIALMVYGRDHCYMKDNTIDYKEFNSIRKNLNLEIASDEEKKHKATYLLLKSNLSQYLQYSLQLFDE